ncbi:MAG TPA: ribonuclease HI family protein [Thermoplasmata archaeon]|nr:ribonuclease HI family protein [Thermoplasmata archaeon]
MGQSKKIKVFSDGAARGNPGPAAIAYSVYDESGVCIDSGARLIGRATNNEAEYEALLLAMDRACAHCKDNAHFYLDSELVVKQVNGKYRARDERMRDYLNEVQLKMKCFRIVRVTHVPRENEGAQLVDRMVNEALDRAG